MAWRIRDWNKFYENNESRKLVKLSWVKIPNKHDGKGYRRLIQMPDGTTLFGVWNAVVQVASKMPTRGLLVDEDGPLSADDISFKTGIPQSLIEQGIGVFKSEAIGWMEDTEEQISRNLPEPREKPVRDRSEQKRSEANGIESSSKHSDAAEIDQVRTWLLEYVKQFAMDFGNPDDVICRRVIRACGGRPLTDLQKLLVSKCKSGQRPRQSWAWFATVVEANFGTEN